jgi:hypothetical protein
MSFCGSSALQGIDQATLQQMLADAQQALASVMTGKQVEIVQVTGAGQHRQVQYNKTNMAGLRLWIGELQRALGVRVPRRSAMRITF